MGLNLTLQTLTILPANCRKQKQKKNLHQQQTMETICILFLQKMSIASVARVKTVESVKVCSTGSCVLVWLGSTEKRAKVKNRAILLKREKDEFNVTI